MEPQLKIKSYAPEASSYSPRISIEQWNQHKSLLKHLHDEGYKRAAMLDILRKQGFTPSMGQLNAKMTAWGFKVYGTQFELQEYDPGRFTQACSFDSTDTDISDLMVGNDTTLGPPSRRSISSITLYDPPTNTTNAHFSDDDLTIESVIVLQCQSLAGSYYPSAKPSDYGCKWPDTTVSSHEASYLTITSVAEFLSAVHCFAQAFDLYYHVFEQLVARGLDENGALIRSLVRCATSATTDEQCAYVSSILTRAQSYCVDHNMTELSTCFALLLQNLCVREVEENHDLFSAQKDTTGDGLLLLALYLKASSVAYQKQRFKQQLIECDDKCSTLSNLSTWCQDTLSFYRLENRMMVRPSSKVTNKINGNTAIEHDFQVLVSALVIDYLNSPGPSMKQVNVECKDRACLFRSQLSPTTSLIVMAHLLYEPLRLQAQTTTNTYLHARAQSFATLQSTTALQELKAFASADSHVRCGAFVDIFLKHLNTDLAYRRSVSSVSCFWDRKMAAKRLAHVIQSNYNDLPSHAGLPGSRRSVIKNLAAPFPHDPSFTESRPSMVSESGSLGDFESLAHQIRVASVAMSSLTASDAMSIDTRSSWSFHQVTGFSQGPISHRNSLSSRRGMDQDEADEYRNFIRDNNYGNQNNQSHPGTLVQRFPAPMPREHST